jgi:hypothetical protein
MPVVTVKPIDAERDILAQAFEDLGLVARELIPTTCSSTLPYARRQETSRSP